MIQVTWLNFKNITLTEKSQTKKDRMIPLTSSYRKHRTIKTEGKWLLRYRRQLRDFCAKEHIANLGGYRIVPLWWSHN